MQAQYWNSLGFKYHTTYTNTTTSGDLTTLDVLYVTISRFIHCSV